jgi:hypothetical protein
MRHRGEGAEGGDISGGGHAAVEDGDWGCGTGNTEGCRRGSFPESYNIFRAGTNGELAIPRAPKVKDRVQPR